MKALVKRHAAPGLWLEDIPEPELGINDVLIRVNKTGICGTDLHIYNWDAWAQKTMLRADAFGVASESTTFVDLLDASMR